MTNERIAELAREAGLAYRRRGDGAITGSNTVMNRQRFAALIEAEARAAAYADQLDAKRYRFLRNANATVLERFVDLADGPSAATDALVDDAMSYFERRAAEAAKETP